MNRFPGCFPGATGEEARSRGGCSRGHARGSAWPRSAPEGRGASSLSAPNMAAAGAGEPSGLSAASERDGAVDGCRTVYLYDRRGKECELGERSLQVPERTTFAAFRASVCQVCLDAPEGCSRAAGGGRPAAWPP